MADILLLGQDWLLLLLVSQAAAWGLLGSSDSSFCCSCCPLQPWPGCLGLLSACITSSQLLLSRWFHHHHAGAWMWRYQQEAAGGAAIGLFLLSVNALQTAAEPKLIGHRLHCVPSAMLAARTESDCLLFSSLPQVPFAASWPEARQPNAIFLTNACSCW